MTNKYSNLLKEIEAVQFTDKNKEQIFNWIKPNKWHITASFNNGQPILIIHTLKKELTVHIGDYLVVIPGDRTNKKRAFMGDEYYPIPAVVFEALYQKNEHSQEHNSNITCTCNSILPV